MGGWDAGKSKYFTVSCAVAWTMRVSKTVCYIVDMALLKCVGLVLNWSFDGFTKKVFLVL